MAQARNWGALFQQRRPDHRRVFEAGAAGSVAVERAILLSLIAIMLIAAGQNAAGALSGALDRLAEAMAPVADRPSIKGAPRAPLSR